jgi:hypothetical protein
VPKVQVLLVPEVLVVRVLTGADGAGGAEGAEGAGATGAGGAGGTGADGAGGAEGAEGAGATRAGGAGGTGAGGAAGAAGAEGAGATGAGGAGGTGAGGAAGAAGAAGAGATGAGGAVLQVLHVLPRPRRQRVRQWNTTVAVAARPDSGSSGGRWARAAAHRPTRRNSAIGSPSIVLAAGTTGGSRNPPSTRLAARTVSRYSLRIVAAHSLPPRAPPDAARPRERLQPPVHLHPRAPGGTCTLEYQCTCT